MNDVSREYGKALYELAADEGLASELLAEVKTARQVLCENPAYIGLLTSPELQRKEREEAIAAAFSGAHPYLLRFLRMMVSLGYGREICDALSEYTRLYHENSGIAVAHIVSAAALSEDEAQRLVNALAARTGKRISPEFEVCPGLLGGIRVEVDGVLYDGTLRRRIDGIRASLSELTL